MKGNRPPIVPPDDGDIFMITARRCRRCGGLLTSDEAILNGYGHTCLKKSIGQREAQKNLNGQINLFEDEGDADE